MAGSNRKDGKPHGQGRFVARAGLLLALGGGVVLGGLMAPDRAAGQQTPPADHVILISVDGLRPEFYRDERWPAPQMQIMATQGVHALAVKGVTPTVTYPSHTTMVTGALPARHGVVHNRPFEPGGATGVWYMEYTDILVPTLWDAVRAAGGTSAGISWPVSAGADIDWNIPEFWSVTGTEGDLFGPAAQTFALRSRVRPVGLLEEIETESLGPFPNYYWGRNLSREDVAGTMAGHIIEKYKPNLLVIHLNQTDYLQHAYGREHPEVRLAVGAVDGAINRMVESARRAGILDRTAFVITGDHGFITVDTRVSPNVWLVQAGLHENRQNRGNWRAAFHTGGGSAFLRLRDPDDQEAVNRVRKILADLPPATRALFRVVERDELDLAGADPEAPLALAAAPGVNMGGETGGADVFPGTGGTHGYFPSLPQVHTGFVAWGAGVGSGGVVSRMDLTDVAPVIAALLGLDFNAPDGVLPTGILATEAGSPSPPTGAQPR